MLRTLALLAPALLIAACGTSPPRGTAETQPGNAAATAATPRGGAYYKDDGPGPNAPANLAAIPDAEPRREPLHRFANRPYEVFGRNYVPLARVEPFTQRGTASWYGRRYHGSKTSSGEPYDMYAMSAAHPTLAIPSYARVTNLANGKSVVVRVNDRGPFHVGRVIDLSYTAAYKLGYAEAGSAPVEVQAVIPGAAQVAAGPATQPGVEQRAEPRPERGAESPASGEARGIFLQLGAFAAEPNAESFRAHMARDLAWLSEVIQVREVDGLFKLRLGPYRSQQDARSVAERIRSELGVAPVLVLR
ncbi:MAG: septal ring lytic transglycosylase RlpA family protein [Betaproteobacteria bacterium]|nr:septal ring lytic transglycosylase RlpA family protein [Betaproteobacteria bacterium]